MAPNDALERAAHALSDGDLWAVDASLKDRVPVVPSRVAFRFGEDPIAANWYTLFLMAYIIPNCCSNDTTPIAMQQEYG